MTKIDTLLAEYAASHTNPINKWIHRIAVPIIAVDMLGLAHALPHSLLFGSAAPSLASVVAALAFVYYLRLSPALAAGMGVAMIFSLAILSAAHSALASAFVPVLAVIFAVAWAAQFYGHAVEGKRPSFLRDLQFLLIGPLWLLDDVYRRVGWSAPASSGGETESGSERCVHGGVA